MLRIDWVARVLVSESRWVCAIIRTTWSLMCYVLLYLEYYLPLRGKICSEKKDLLICYLCEFPYSTTLVDGCYSNVSTKLFLNWWTAMIHIVFTRVWRAEFVHTGFGTIWRDNLWTSSRIEHQRDFNMGSSLRKRPWLIYQIVIRILYFIKYYFYLRSSFKSWTFYPASSADNICQGDFTSKTYLIIL